MSQFYCWLLSVCCDAKIHNGLGNEDRRNECVGCGKHIDMDKGCYAPIINGQNPWQMSEELDKRFSIEEICSIWYSLYGEEMEEDYPGFVDELKQRIS